MAFVYSFLGSLAAIFAVGGLLLWVYSDSNGNPHDEMDLS